MAVINIAHWIARSVPGAIALAFVSAAQAFPPDGVSVGIGIGLRGDNLTIGPQVGYGHDVYSDRNWNSDANVSAFAPLLVIGLRRGSIRNGFGTLTLDASFHVDPAGALDVPQLPVFHPSGRLGITTTFGNGDPSLDYYGGFYLIEDRYLLRLDLPVLEYRYDIGEGSKLNFLYQSIDFSGGPGTCTEVPFGGVLTYDCRFESAVIRTSGGPSAIPEPATWLLLTV
jgi:hypothetical protein